MDITELRNTYIQLNNSFKKRLVFHLGVDAGFFSEFNNMVLAILYCLDHKIRFELYSADANFGIEKGWTDFFLPFCNEDLHPLHSTLNPRWTIKTFKEKMPDVMQFKKEHNIDYLTFDIWHKFNNYFYPYHYFNIPELNIRGFTQTVAQQIIKIIWNYNEQTEQLITVKKSSFDEMKPFIGFHIRSGDKFIEASLLSPEKYIEKAEKHSKTRRGFILTDDYSIFESLCKKYSSWDFYTLCDKSEKGYFHEEYLKKSQQEKTDMLFNLFASCDIITNSELFIGTYSSNPGMFLGMRKNKDSVIGLDFKHWRIRW